MLSHLLVSWFYLTKIYNYPRTNRIAEQTTGLEVRELGTSKVIKDDPRKAITRQLIGRVADPDKLGVPTFPGD